MNNRLMTINVLLQPPKKRIWTFPKKKAAHFIEGRCRSTTSTACTGLVLIGLSSSRGSGMLRPVSTSWSMCQLTRDTNLMETLKGRSFPPSPGRVTSRSTFGEGKERESGSVQRRWDHLLKVGFKCELFGFYALVYVSLCIYAARVCTVGNEHVRSCQVLLILMLYRSELRCHKSCTGVLMCWLEWTDEC